MSPPPLPLSVQYQDILGIWDGIVGDLNKKIAAIEDLSALEGAKEARRLFDNTRSLFLSWVCDIRADSGGLEKLQDTAIALLVRAASVDDEFYLKE
ncbi:hypothetical protein GJ744_010547 [Endocarpon pusillum]|uniref:Uncharacterized protein n=1 Tax=Endocarpon pusillum TaxID=364733 RepID=A0A8H7AU09_9EURO|nr:hypothetical protein GJ744_010547 [Endocarpon pusillum]